MSSGIIVDVQPESCHEPGPQLPQPQGVSRFNAFDRWLNERINLVVAAVLVAAFVARVYVAGRGFLNPDEALHYLIVNQKSALGAYRTSLTNAHPPLIYLVLYYWSVLGRSELLLRLPSVICGTATCWVAYKWIERVFGKTAGLIGLILVAFSPALIALSAEVRSYALLLCFETAALYLLEAALQEKSSRGMWHFSIVLYLAILSHYSAVFFVAAAGVYALARIVESRLSRDVIVSWASGQAGALALYVFLYITHVSKIKQNITIWAMPYDQSYFHPDRDGLLSFTWQRTTDIFTFVFENHYIVSVLLVLWLVAVGTLVLGELTRYRENLGVRHSGLLLLLPFVATWGAAICGFYPYVGSRHTVFLVPFLIAAVSFLLAAVNRQKLWAAMVMASLLAAASNASGKTFEPYISKENQSRALMAAAVDYMQQEIPTGDLILTDYQSALILVYYFCGPKLILPAGTFNLPVSRVKCNGHSLAFFQTWSMQPQVFLSNFAKMARAQRLKPGDKAWFFQSGWGVTLKRELPLVEPQFRCLQPENFGDNISLMSFEVGPDLSPVPPKGDCSALNSGLNSGKSK